MIEVFGNWLDTTVQDTVRSLKINSCGAQTIGTEADTFYGVLSHLSTYSNMYFMSCPDLSNWRKFKVNVRFPPHKAAAEKKPVETYHDFHSARMLYAGQSVFKQCGDEKHISHESGHYIITKSKE